MRNSNQGLAVGGLALFLALAACSLGGPPPKPTLTPEPPASTPTVEAVVPAAPPAPTENLAPTALPAPTQILPPTAGPAAANSQTPGADTPGITLNPALGEPGDVTIVNGSGWPANAMVDLHWGPPSGPAGPVVWSVTADASGAFNVDLKIPPADKWPGGPPHERDLLQLRATSVSTGVRYAFANFTYIKRFIPPTLGPSGPSETPVPPTVTPTATP